MEHDGRPLTALLWAVQEANVVSASLEVLNDLLTRFGGLMTEDHARLIDNLLPLLEGNRSGVKKRATHCLGNLLFCPQRHDAYIVVLCDRNSCRTCELKILPHESALRPSLHLHVPWMK